MKTVIILLFFNCILSSQSKNPDPQPLADRLLNNPECLFFFASLSANLMTLSEGNYSSIIQIGNDNLSFINQSGVNNECEILQEGNNNEYRSFSDGLSIRLNSKQFGNNNILIQDLAGSDIEYVIEQNGSENKLIQIESGKCVLPLKIIQNGNSMEMIILNGK